MQFEVDHGNGWEELKDELRDVALTDIHSDLQWMTVTENGQERLREIKYTVEEFYRLLRGKFFLDGVDPVKDRFLKFVMPSVIRASWP